MGIACTCIRLEVLDETEADEEVEAAAVVEEVNADKEVEEMDVIEEVVVLRGIKGDGSTLEEVETESEESVLAGVAFSGATYW